MIKLLEKMIGVFHKWILPLNTSFAGVVATGG
jgi:hypothetical protein